jgi:asparagine synthase (glutamine-hydrolysing)
MADVPVGCFLSGGVDSSLVASGMQERSNHQVETFSIGFAERGYDESGESTELAKALGVKHHVEILDPPTFEDVEALLQRYDQPFGDSAAVPTYLLSRVAHERVKVVLTGDGGDEVFGGYERYRLMLLAGKLGRVQGLRTLGHELLRRGGRSMSAGRVAGRLILAAASGRVDAYRALMAPFDAKAVEALLPGASPALFAREADCFRDARDVTVAAQVADLTTYLPSCLTTKVDIASMATSLETRAPFLDHRLVEIGLALPRRERVRLGRTKVLLRAVASKRVGPKVARRKKRGFGVPLEVWLRGPMRAEACRYLLGSEARTTRLLDADTVKAQVRRFFDGDRSLYFRIWTLIALEAWLRGPLGGRGVL